MSGIDAVGTHLKAVWRLMLGDAGALSHFDLTAPGVGRSFAAILWCLPAMAVSWSAWRMFYLADMPQGTSVGAAFVGKLLVVDLATWILPLLLIAALAGPLGYFPLLAAIVVTTNWLSVPIFYAMALPAAIRLLIPDSDGLTASVSLLFLTAAFIAIFRLLKTLCGAQMLLATALSALFILPSLMIGETLQRFFELVPP